MVAETPGDAGWESLPASQDVVFDSKEVESFLGEVTHEFMRRIDGHRRGISWAATFFRHGDAHTIAAGSDVARAADQEQCSFEDGPGLEAIRSGEFVHLADTARDRRWPGYAAAAADHGVRSLLCMPIVSTAGSSAAINLYASTPHAFTSEDIVLTRVRTGSSQGASRGAAGSRTRGGQCRTCRSPKLHGADGPRHQRPDGRLRAQP